MATNKAPAASRPRLLDLFCGAGGAAMGYHRAGFDVLGIDLHPQPRYPFRFVQMDALDFLRQDCVSVEIREAVDDFGGDLVGGPLVAVGDLDVQVDQDRARHGAPSVGVIADSAKPALRVKDFDAIHASPPCQDYSRSLRHMAAAQPRLIDPVRDLLAVTGLPWVIENVEGAPLPRQDTLDGRYGLELCGTMFGLRIGWHRLFEASVPLVAPRESCRCDSVYVLNPHNVAGRDRMYAEFGRGDPEAAWRRERGTDWMGRYEAREAIPPAYTEFIGRQLLAYVRTEVAA